jgi:hypothetical protein
VTFKWLGLARQAFDFLLSVLSVQFGDFNSLK